MKKVEHIDMKKSLVEYSTAGLSKFSLVASDYHASGHVRPSHQPLRDHIGDKPNHRQRNQRLLLPRNATAAT